MDSKEKEQSLKLAEHYFRSNNYSFAQQILDKVIKEDSNNSKANELLAYIYGNSGEIDTSFELLNVACNQNSCSPEALYYLGSMQLKRNLFIEAIKTFKKSISKGGEFFEALHDLATAQASVGDLTSSLDNYQKCLKFGETSFELFFNIARIFDELKRYDEALAHYDKALSLKPDYAEGWSNKGVVLNELKRYDEALAHYDKALRLKPEYAEAWSNKGGTLNELRRYNEAIAHYDKALNLKPEYAEAWSNKGGALNELRRYDEAVAHYEKALSLKPDIDWIYGDLAHTKMRMCNWSTFPDALEIISKKLTVNEKVISPFKLLSLNDKATLHKKCSEVYVQSKHPTIHDLGPILKHRKNEKIRVGYFSCDFRNHPISILMAELFELHDKSKFEIIAFSFGIDDESLLRLRLSKAFNQFIDVSGMSDLDIATLSRELCIDIAVDLGGHTAGARTNIFAYRAAPIQVSYLGYLGTIGAEYIDYIFADNTTIPKCLKKLHTEKIVYLPSYQVNDRKRHISDKQFIKTELSLPETSFIFCCFNNNYKILPATFDGWMRILKAVHGSVLFLYAENEWVEQNLKKEAIVRGVESTKLVFGKQMPTAEYLARYQVCDLFLDTFPYNAGATASDALWAGLPVLTLMGQSFASRMAASILNAIGLSELITTTQKEYEALAIELAINPQKLADIKYKLETNRLTASLFDTPLFTKNIETAYIRMVERYHADLEPEHINIFN
jgi:predicted O-linked N-acetylglucosamine transferase (SPINDLY family)